MSRMRWLQVILVISLSINLLIAGAMLGRLRDRPPPLGWAVQQLDDDTRRSLRPIMRQQAARTMETRRQLRRLQRRVRYLMGEPELDRAELGKALADLRSMGGEYQRSMHGTAIDVLAELTPEQRLRVAGRLLRPMPPPEDPRQRDRRQSIQPK